MKDFTKMYAGEQRQALLSAEMAGRIAFYRSKTASNPHLVDTPLYWAWVLGFARESDGKEVE